MPAKQKYSREARELAYNMYVIGRAPRKERYRGSRYACTRGKYTGKEIEAATGIPARYAMDIGRGIA
jgi:hypothetical protein